MPGTVNLSGEEHLTEKIEILSVQLLDENRELVSELKELARSLNMELGWHYLLDLTWILKQLGPVAGKRLMDAGAGTGLIQWYLAQAGAEVISVDRLDRSALPLHFRSRFRVQGLRPTDLLPANRVPTGPFFRRWLKKIISQVRSLAYDIKVKEYQRPSALAGTVDPKLGRVWIYNQDMANLAGIPDDSLDAIVSVSALEHNTPQGLEAVVKELMRVLKPGGVLLATLTAGRDKDWWHEPSSGMCYTDATLRKLFALPADAPSNYSQYDQLFEALRNCAELRDNLARFYFKSAKNGMPWGKWDPQYQPVGVCKIKEV